MSFHSLNRPLHLPPGWSQPRVIVLSATDAEQLSSQINCLLASEDFYVLALSAATTTATFVEEPWCSTVIFQERIANPNEATS